MDHICESWDKLWIDEYYSKEKRMEKRETGKQHLFSAIIVCSPFLLYRLLEVSKLRKGHRIIYRDGTHGTLVDGSKLIVNMVSPDVRSRKSQDKKVTSKAPIGFYLIAPEEYKDTTIAGDIWAKYIVKALFDRDLEFDWAASDGAPSFIYGSISVWKELQVLNCNFHKQQLIGTHRKSSKGLLQAATTDYVREKGPTHMNNLQYCRSQKMFDTCMKLFLDDWRDHGDHKAASYIQNNHATYPHSNWWYNVTGK
jgi:hypothetical protein